MSGRVPVTEAATFELGDRTIATVDGQEIRVLNFDGEYTRS